MHFLAKIATNWLVYFVTLTAIVLLFALMSFLGKNLVIRTIKNSKRKKILLVKKASSKYRALLEVNNQFEFYPIEHQYCYSEYTTTRRQAENFDFDKACFRIVQEEYFFFQSLLDQIAFNTLESAHYQSRIESIMKIDNEKDIQESGLKSSFFNKYEKELINKTLLRPLTGFNVVITVSYSSPTGRSRYQNYCTYSSLEIQELISRSQIMKKSASQSSEERLKMTPKLRYQILCRDLHKCTICGRSAKDGVTLEVDHIIPISRGGKTEASNLRTLCRDCNRGKGSYYVDNRFV